MIEDVYKPYGSFSEHFIKVTETRIPGIVLGVRLSRGSEQ